MKKEENNSEIVVLAELLTTMKEAVEKMETARKEKNAESLAEAEHEILRLRKKIDELL